MWQRKGLGLSVLIVLDFLGIGSTCASSFPVEMTHGGAENAGGLSAGPVEKISRLNGRPLNSSDDMADAMSTEKKSKKLAANETGDDWAFILPRVSTILSDSQL